MNPRGFMFFKAIEKVLFIKLAFITSVAKL